MNITRRTRVALALASCALMAAPAAQAMVSEGSNTSTPATTPIVAQGDDHARTVVATTSTPVPTVGDDHARTTPATVSTAFVPVRDDHARTTSTALFPPHGSYPVSAAPPTALSAPSASGGFDWEDAGIGFGSAAGLALLAGGILVSTRRMRGSRTLSV